MSKYYDEANRQLLRWVILYGYEPVVIPINKLGSLQDYDLLLTEGFIAHEVNIETGSLHYTLRKAVAQYQLKRMEKQNG